jgi:hippurate hydrolase
MLSGGLENWSGDCGRVGRTRDAQVRAGLPATINHDRESAFAADVAEALVGKDNVVRNLDPSMGSEDFSFMLQAKPGAFARLGQGGAEGGCFLHNSTYDFNDDVIPLGAGYLASLAERAMPLSSR